MALKNLSKFLPPTPPRNARAHRIDFTTTNPPIPQYKNFFAAVIDDVFTESECEELIRIAESSTLTPTTKVPTWERAMINIGGGRQTLAPNTRNCGRIIYDTPDLAQKILYRLMPFLQEFKINKITNAPSVTGFQGRDKTYTLTRLNERLRFLKYEGGEYFKPHWDGSYVTPDRSEASYYTVHIYLNGDGEQDLKELKEAQRQAEREKSVNLNKEGKLLGGATSFIGKYTDGGQVRVFPKTGRVLVFQHSSMLHGGDGVFRGVKYTLRTDIMYREA